MKKPLLLLWAVLFCLVLKGQELPKVVPPSPEAASFMRLTDVPLDKYRGLPNISIPIHTINLGEINIPITIDYHARGVTVEELSSRTGIGWTLNAGGAISRKIVGSADEDSYGLCQMSNLLQQISSSSSARKTILDTEIITNSTSYFLPDEFSFSFLGSSGKFIIDYVTKKPLLKKYDDIQIEYVGDNDCVPQGYKIKDKMGNVYHFGVVGEGVEKRVAHSFDLTQESGSESQGNIKINTTNLTITVPVTTWHLLQIDTYTGKKVEFYYEEEDVIFRRRSYDESQLTAFSKIRSHQMQLSEIHYESEKIKFISEISDREDLIGGKALDKIEIYYKTTLVKEYDLVHNYSNSGTIGLSNVNSYYQSVNDSYDRKRLVLKKIQQKKAQKSLPGYEFNYSEVNLPHRFSNSQDMWGYYNGADNGRYLSFKDTPNYSRRVNEELSEAGMLKSIKYPTGSMLVLNYEHNTFMKPYFWDRDLSVETINPLTEYRTSFTKANTIKNHAGNYEGIFLNNKKTKIKGKYFANCKLKSDVSDAGCDYTYYLDRINGSDYPSDFYYSLDYSFNNGSHGDLTFSQGSFTNSPPILGYKLTVIPNDTNRNPEFQSDFVVDIISYADERPEVIFGPGKRIKKTFFKDSVNNNILIKEYSYDHDNGISSGKLFGLPFFYDVLPELGNSVTRIRHSSGGGSIYTSLFSRDIGYSSVTEYIGDSINNVGKIEYKYLNISDTQDGYWRFPYHTPNDNSWLRGKNLKTLTYKVNEQGDYFLIKEITNTYKFANELDLEFIGDKIGGNKTPNLEPYLQADYNYSHDAPSEIRYSKDNTFFKYPLISFFPEISNSSINVDKIGYKIYYLTGGTADLVKTSETNYFDSGNTVTTTSYSYDYENHYQLAGLEAISSKGEFYRTNNKYETSLIPFRVLPSETKTYKNDILLSHQNTVYKSFGELYLPETIQTSKGLGSLEPRLVYHSYDNKGNPLELSKADGTRVVYIWGYQDTQPIVKIENATYEGLPSSVTSLINQIKTASNTESTATEETNLRSLLNQLRNHTHFANSRVSTYTYDPLIGVTSITDPRGATVYYEYDDFNRLVRVKDQEGNVVTEHTYNYKNNN